MTNSSLEAIIQREEKQIDLKFYMNEQITVTPVSHRKRDQHAVAKVQINQPTQQNQHSDGTQNEKRKLTSTIVPRGFEKLHDIL